MSKFILLMLVLALLVGTSTVDAGACENGFRSGQRAVQRMWQDEFDQDCRDIRRLSRAAGRMTSSRGRRRGWGRGRGRRNNNWRNRSFDRCFQDGATKMAEVYETECDCDAVRDRGRGIVREVWLDTLDAQCDDVSQLPDETEQALKRARITGPDTCVQEGVQEVLKSIKDECFEIDCDKARTAGKDIVERIWRRRLRRKCDNAWDLASEVDDYMRRRRIEGPAECVAEGVQEMMNRIEYDCFEVTTEQVSRHPTKQS